MKRYTNSLLIFSALLMAGFARFTASDKPVYVLDTASILISGRTNTEPWTMRGGALTTNAAFSLVDGKLTAEAPLDFSVPVKGFTTSILKMDRDIYKFLKGYPYDKVYYKNSYTTIAAKGKNTFAIKMTGNLAIAGITQITDLDLICEAVPDRQLLMHGSAKLSLKKFRISFARLPSSMKVDDQVNVDVDLSFKRASR